MKLLRTPDERFADLPDFPFDPQYLEIASGDGYDVLDGKAKLMTIDGIDVTANLVAGAKAVLKIAQEKLVEAVAGPDNLSQDRSNIAIGYLLLVIAKEIIKLNWESNYENNMKRVTEQFKEQDGE